jgi:hypothetical protein
MPYWPNNAHPMKEFWTIVEKLDKIYPFIKLEESEIHSIFCAKMFIIHHWPTRSMFTKLKIYTYTQTSLMSKPKLSTNATKSQRFQISCSHPSTNNKLFLLGLCVAYCARIGCKWPLELVRSSSPSTRSLLMFFLFQCRFVVVFINFLV